MIVLFKKIQLSIELGINEPRSRHNEADDLILYTFSSDIRISFYLDRVPVNWIAMSAAAYMVRYNRRDIDAAAIYHQWTMNTGIWWHHVSHNVPFESTIECRDQL